jgi:hypothetical protein
MEILLPSSARWKFTTLVDTIVGLLLHKSRGFGFSFSSPMNTTDIVILSLWISPSKGFSLCGTAVSSIVGLRLT